MIVLKKKSIRQTILWGREIEVGRETEIKEEEEEEEEEGEVGEEKGEDKEEEETRNIRNEKGGITINARDFIKL